MNTKTSLTSLKESLEDLDLIYIFLLRLGRFTLLPEIYSIFDKEATLKFIELFAGCTIEVPTVEEIQKHARDIIIYSELSKKKSTVKELSERYEIPPKVVLEIYQKVKQFVEDINNGRNL